MKTNDDVLARYCAHAPLALALERVVECRIYPTVPLERPMLDLGCGDGLFAAMLFAEKVDTGIDPNPDELRRAGELGAYEELIGCFGDRIPKPDGSYKTVISNSVVEHIPDLLPVLREIARILAPGGHFHFTAPSQNFERFTFVSLSLEALGLDRLHAAFRRFFNRFWAHYHAYPLDQWKDLAASCGFEIAAAYTYAPRKACLLNTFLTPFGVPSKIVKSLTNRWVLFPRLRSLYSTPASACLRPLLDGAERCEDGGLVFLSLRKRPA